MNGYLMQRRDYVRGQDTFLESFPPDGRHGVVFEDDSETAYFYAVEKDAAGQGVIVLDALHISESPASAPAKPSTRRSAKPAAAARKSPAKPAASAPPAPSTVAILWSRDWQAAALVIGDACHAIFDFAAHGGYNINEFPAPNGIWTQGDRKLTAERIQRLF